MPKSAEPATFSIAEFTRLLGSLCEKSVRRAIVKDEIRSIRIGGRILIPRSELARMKGELVV